MQPLRGAATRGIADGDVQTVVHFSACGPGRLHVSTSEPLLTLSAHSERAAPIAYTQHKSCSFSNTPTKLHCPLATPSETALSQLNLPSFQHLPLGGPHATSPHPTGRGSRGSHCCTHLLGSRALKGQGVFLTLLSAPQCLTQSRTHRNFQETQGLDPAASAYDFQRYILQPVSQPTLPSEVPTQLALEALA